VVFGAENVVFGIKKVGFRSNKPIFYAKLIIKAVALMRKSGSVNA